MSRRIKCDEQKPTCRRCYISHRECSGLGYGVPEGNLAPPRRQAPSFKGSLFPGVNTVKAGSVYKEAEPPDWPFMQALKYCKTLRIANDCIRGVGPWAGRIGAFGPINNMFDSDFEINGSTWQAHANGIFAYIDSVGGMHALLSKDYRLKGYRAITLLIHHVPEDMPCPTKLFLAIIHITRHRVLAAHQKDGVTSRRRRLPLTPPTVTAIYKDISAFDVDAWTKEVEIDDLPLSHLLARIYQTAVLLYGVLTLPPAASRRWAASQPRLAGRGPLDSVRVSKRDELMKQMREFWSQAPDQTAICWPLAVAGVALVDGELADQIFVETCLYGMWMSPGTNSSPFECRRKLLEFWKSDKTGWEDCFNEPIPSVG
ncbi:hypothetical protein PWT90_03588 [Aphanocladium album]|nr:hypothetical protein PWT90_03588 [Aphanocladium album]